VRQTPTDDRGGNTRELSLPQKALNGGHFASSRREPLEIRLAGWRRSTYRTSLRAKFPIIGKNTGKFAESPALEALALL
jgi:hypothetical protein